MKHRGLTRYAHEQVAGSCIGLAKSAALAMCAWFVYLVRTAAGGLYCGISTDPARRFAQHKNGRGARFFSTSPAQALVYIEPSADKSSALRRECALKKLSKPAKEQLIESPINQAPSAPGSL